MSERTMTRVEELRQAAFDKNRAGDFEDAIALYDEALLLCEDEETRELITINKADTLITLERTGPEVQELPKIVMRRRNPRHVWLASYSLLYKNRLENQPKRAGFYGQIALEMANQANEPFWKMVTLNELGIVYEVDSQFDRAIECFEEALRVSAAAPSPLDALSRGYAIENLGYCRVIRGEVQEGIDLIHDALQLLTDPIGSAEAYVDLCFAYLEIGDLERSRFYGEAGLELAKENRQIRNAHYLLGEVAYKQGDSEAAEHHFDSLARFYPEFRHLKSLLFAIDLRSMVNLKL